MSNEVAAIFIQTLILSLGIFGTGFVVTDIQRDLNAREKEWQACVYTETGHLCRLMNEEEVADFVRAMK